MLDDLLTREVHSRMCCGYGLQDSGLDQVRSTRYGKKHRTIEIITAVISSILHRTRAGFRSSSKNDLIKLHRVLNKFYFANEPNTSLT